MSTKKSKRKKPPTKRRVKPMGLKPSPHMVLAPLTAEQVEVAEWWERTVKRTVWGLLALAVFGLALFIGLHGASHMDPIIPR